MDRIEKLNEFLKNNPADSFVQHALGLEYIKIGNEVEAERLFEAILEREPGYVGTYYHLGKLLERKGDVDRAKLVYEKGMEESKKIAEMHAYGELKGAIEALNDE
ncbi:MAG: hypothetical protein H7Y42_15240 [Chitinophagaceae bacterium]|nr:hypothetical protein [Chitinophagaceae bacterium]